MRENLNRIMVETTGQKLDKISRDTDRDYILTAAQAMEYGLIDEVLAERS